MNKSYVCVWNEALGSWVAASENTVARGKRSASRRVVVAAVAAIVGSTALVQVHEALAANNIPNYDNVNITPALIGGPTATSSGAGSIAIGAAAKATGENGGDWSAIAIGSLATASGQAAMAIGEASTASGNRSIALGNSSSVTGANGVSVGADSKVTGAGGTALGQASFAAGGAVALGNSASATAANSVALGANSTTTANLGAAAYNPGATTLSGTAPAGEVSVGSAGQERRLTNVAAGSAATDAVNVSQLQSEAAKSNALGAATAAALGGGSIYDSRTGAVSAPSYSVGGTKVDSVGDAITNIDGRTTQNTNDITNVQNQLANGSIGLVQQDAATGDITVGKDAGGTEVNMAGTAGDRKVTGVAAGAVNATSVDAINGGQLYNTAAGTAAALGGGSTVNADGTISAPSYSVGGTTVHNVGDAVSNLDGRVTENTTDIASMQNQLNSGSLGLVQQNPVSTGVITVGASTGGTVINVAGTDGNRQITGVADGTADNDAVNFSQLSKVQSELQSQVNSLGGQIANNVSQSTVNNPDYSGSGVGSAAIGAGSNAAADNSVAIGANSTATGSNSVALGQGSVADRDNTVSVGSVGNERQITNVAAGTANTDAVNVGQMNDSVAQGVGQANAYTDQRIGAMNQQINDVAKKSYSGSAAAIATANLPQAPAPGTRIVSVAGGTYVGQSALAVGVSTFTGNGKWIVKASGSTTTSGTFGFGIGAGRVF